MVKGGSFQFDKDSLGLLREALERMEEGFSSLPAFDPPHVNQAAMRKVLLETASRMHDNYPYFHPQYAGQMLKPPHPVARLAYSLAMPSLTTAPAGFTWRRVADPRTSGTSRCCWPT